MRTNRVIVAGLAGALLGVVPMGAGNAAAPTAEALAQVQSASSEATSQRAAKRERKFKVRIKNSRQRILAGSVKPKVGKRVRVIVMRAKNPNGNFKKSRTFKTKKNGKFQTQFPRGNYYFYLVVKGNNKFKRAESGKYVVRFS